MAQLDKRNTPYMISAIIVNYNGGVYLRSCIQSLQEQTYPIHEIIIVDNASSDSSLQSISNLTKCKVIKQNYNTGFAVATNLAVAHVNEAEWLLLLNPDANLEPNWLESMIEVASHQPEAVMLASRLIQYVHRDMLDGAGDVFHVSGAHWRRGHGQHAKDQYMTSDDVFSPCAAAALYRRKAFVEAGGFDESFFCYGEDIDLAFRVRMLGYRCLYVPTAVAYHAGSASTSRRSDFAVYFGHRNLVWVYFKNMPMILMWAYLPQHLLWNIVTIIWFIRRGQGKTILRAKWDAIKGLPQVFHKRREVQALRKVSLRTLLGAMERGVLRAYFGRH